MAGTLSAANAVIIWIAVVAARVTAGPGCIAGAEQASARARRSVCIVGGPAYTGRGSSNPLSAQHGAMSSGPSLRLMRPPRRGKLSA